MKKLLIFILTIIMSSSVFSQENKRREGLLLDQLDVSDLDTVFRSSVITINTASRSLKSIEELPITTYVITKQEIQENNYKTLADVLRNIPGVRVSQPGDAKSGETFIINGLLGNYYTKILLNGIAITPSGSPGMPIGGQLPIRQAERIEIITNPSSAIYGADAMGGVINIITDRNQKRSTYGNAVFSVGNYGYNEINLMLGGNIGKDDNVFKYNFIANHSDHSDLNTKNNYDNLYNLNNYVHIDTSGLAYNPYYEGTAEKPFFGNLPSTSLMLGFGLEYKRFKFNMIHFTRRAHSAIGNLPYFSSYQLPDTYWGEGVSRYDLTYEYASKRFNSQSTISYESYRMNNGSSELHVNSLLGINNGLKFKYGASDDIIFDQLFSFLINEKSNIVFGMNFNYSGNLPIDQTLDRPFSLRSYRAFSDRLRSNESGYYILDKDQMSMMKSLFGDDYKDLSPIRFHQFGLFGQYDYTSDRFSLLLDLRYDYHSMYGSSLSPRVSSMYKITDDFKIRATYTKAFKAPSSYYKYSSYIKPNVSSYRGYIFYPNTKLDNERLQAIEVGLTYDVDKNTTIDLISNYYIRDNEIIFSFSNPDIDESVASKYSYYGYVNNRGYGSTNFSLQGIVRSKDIVPEIHLDIDGSVTFQKREETTNPDLLRYDTYRNQPDLLINVNVKFNIYKDVQLITNVYGSSEYTNSYYDFYSKIFPGQDISNILTDESNSALWANMMLNYRSNDNFSFYLGVKNIFNSNITGVQTSDPLKGLYYNPQNGRMLEFGVNFKMF